MTAIAERFIFGLAAATEIEWRKLALGEFFSHIVQNQRAPSDLIGSIFESFYRYVSHTGPPGRILLKTSHRARNGSMVMKRD
jgi:hypothetical protein